MNFDTQSHTCSSVCTSCSTSSTHVPWRAECIPFQRSGCPWQHQQQRKPWHSVWTSKHSTKKDAERSAAKSCVISVSKHTAFHVEYDTDQRRPAVFMIVSCVKHMSGLVFSLSVCVTVCVCFSVYGCVPACVLHDLGLARMLKAWMQNWILSDWCGLSKMLLLTNTQR
jgi:hypothetical protein